LGAILTLAVAQGDTLNAGLMLAIYGIGMVAPLTLLAAIWDKIGPRTMRVLRGRGFQFMGRQFHTTSVITGLLIAGIGVLFWDRSVLVIAPSLLPATAQRWLHSSISILANPSFDAVLLGALVIIIGTVWAVRRTRDHLVDTSPYAAPDAAEKH